MKIYKEIEKSFPKLEELLDDTQLAEFKALRLSDLNNYRSDLSAWIIANLLDKKNAADGGALRQCFVENGIKREASMASVVINLFHFYIANR